MKRSWKDLGEVWSGRDLQEGERVTVSVFDKSLNVLLEQINFRPERDEHRPQMVWVVDFCRHINDRSALIRAGVEDDSGEWDILESGYRNKYWNITSRDLVVLTTVPRSNNWATSRRVAMHSTEKLALGTKLRMNVRTSSGDLLETVSFTAADPKRLTSGLWTKDFCIQINNTSHYVRAGRQNNHLLEPHWEDNSNWIWMPFNGEFLSVTWSKDSLTDAGKIQADRDALDGERISFFAFDDIADKPLDRITLTASASKKRLGKAQWPADLARQINASSGHAGAGVSSGTTFTPKDSASDNVISHRYAELRTFTTALHLDNWEEQATLHARYDLLAKWRMSVTVSTSDKGNFCEALTFAPDPERLKSTQWPKDLAAYINQHSLYLKAGVKDTAKKTIVPQETADTNVIWAPKGAKLKVTYEMVAPTRLVSLKMERDMKDGEACRVYVLDDTTEDILRDIGFVPSSKRTGSNLGPKDLALRINAQTQLVAAGYVSGDAAPDPTWDKENQIYACHKNVRAFTTLLTLGNWDKGAQLGKRDLKVNEQVIVRVKGSKTGRIFESMVFWPTAGRYGVQSWTLDLSKQINARSRFIRAGEEKPELFLMEPAFSMTGNHLWTPKGAGLEVELEIISGIAQVLPGMTSEARQLFDQHAQAQRLITVDARTGLPTLQIPVAELFADDSLSDSLNVALVNDPEHGVRLQIGKENRRLPRPDKFSEQEFLITLRDGRKLKVNSAMGAINGGDFKVELIVEWNEFFKELGTVGFSVIYEDGFVEEFRFASEVISGQTREILRLSRCKLPDGKFLELVYGVSGQLEKVVTGQGTVLQVDWFKIDVMLDLAGAQIYEYILKSLVVFPDGNGEKLTYTFTKRVKSDLIIKFQRDGFSSAGNVLYTIVQDRGGRMMGIDVERQLEVTAGTAKSMEKALYKETLQYGADGKVKRHDICPGSGIDDLVHEWTYANNVSRLTGYFRTVAPRTAFERYHRFDGQHSSLEDYGSTRVPICRKHSHEFDEKNKCLVSRTKVWEGDVLVEDQSMSIDGIGNPISRTDNGETRYYTYYNNYQQFEVIEVEEKVQDKGLFGIIFGAFDYVNPIGWGLLAAGSGGVTWGTYIKTTVNMLPATNDYAKKAFNLPVDIVHCGSDGTFSGDVESELVTRRVNGAEHAQRLTYFGYAMVSGRVRVTKKLTVLQPDSIKADVEAEQLATAKAAAKPFLDSLDKQAGKASGDEKKAYEQTKASLLKSLVAQSKENKEGYKLQTWKAASMFVETLEYHTDDKQPGFGTLKSLKTELLSKDGKVIANSARTTTYDYTEDSADTNRLVIKTTVSRTGETDIVSSQTRSRLTGRLYESVDSEGIKTVFTYDPEGNLTSETVSKDKTEQRKTTCTLVSKLECQYDLVENGVTSRLLQDVHGRRKTLLLKPSGATGFLEIQHWEYDKVGRASKSVETDYGKDNKKISERYTSWSYDELNGRVSISNVLKDGTGKELKKTSQTLTPNIRGETFSQGTFSVDRQFNPNRSYLIEHYRNGSENSCKIERTVADDGLLKSVRYLKIDKSGKETEHDKVTYEYDQYAQLSKASPKQGAESSYTYDCVGRLVSTTREGVTLRNGYDPASLAPVASTGQVNGGTFPLVLGQQTVDMLGRVSSQTVNKSATQFSYTGGSRRSTLKSPGSAPKALKGYSSSADEKTRTHTQTVTVDSTELASTLVFSTSGRLLSFKDLSGSTTAYEYDFFNRVIRSTSDHCECHFTYGDNGLLSSESIKALKAGNLIMKVAYSYDELGQEIKRTFTCEGVDTLSLERALRADGRLAKSTLKKAGKDQFSDSYEYDECLRLKEASGGPEHDRFAYDMLGNMINGDSRAFWYDEGTGLLGTVKDIPVGTQRPVGTVYTPNSHDASGRLTDDGKRKISYHGNGQIDTYSRNNDPTPYTFSYDSEGRVRGGTIGKKSDTYFYRGECVYALKQSDSAKTEGFAKRTMILRNESRACLLQDSETDGKSSRSFELRDANGTVFASVDLASKAIVLFRYSPYGRRYAGYKPENWLGFKGEPLNSLGFYYLGNGYRAYDPAWGRFLTRDSLSPFGVGGAAGYVYCNGDPINNHDPSGHQTVAQYERWGTTPFIHTTAFRITVGALGVLLAPFTAGTSILLAVATTALAAVSFALDVASIILSESDPELARTLETWGQAFAIASAAAGISMSLNSIKGVPRNMLKVRGGLPGPQPTKLIRAPAELRHAQQVRSKALSGLIRGAEEAKAAGTYDVFKARYFHPEPGSVNASVPAGGSGTRLTQRAGNTAKNLVTGIITQVDASVADALGTLLDLHAGPNTLVQKFLSPPPGETTIVSIVAGPIAGREKLFP
ncbi:RHS repeat-associated core domain-containing protein [Pseudomonas sp. 148P]|uniref:RHS repeat-associated core domain-containing protein n=1 Tax=Pseudomonas ulcerans TaxID=3115852 RepID=A0ABU7HZZ5_9PSED|nr:MULTISPECIES: RHS repeat-associated core domain-containing protein [unclassified Pseudomonas]MEE1924993.1 RHS repeat-associated core domain-containing protein [Pseudomonas sp. 147P]MEE1936978.1 RHS repeat-associated core domain-containing protein [Pseudomonas sp. 148P]